MREPVYIGGGGLLGPVLVLGNDGDFGNHGDFGNDGDFGDDCDLGNVCVFEFVVCVSGADLRAEYLPNVFR